MKQSFQKLNTINDLKDHIKNLQKSSSNIVVMGDFNVAPSKNDIGIGEVNVQKMAA